MQKETIALIERISNSLKPGSHPGLERVKAFCVLAGQPEQLLKAIHVAGTNGKGSVSNMTRLVLTQAGYRTAVFNSPYLSSPLEYFQIDGCRISEERFCKLCSSLLDKAVQMPEPPTEFEFYTIAALVYFQEEQCDFAVIEAGMGGRLDATNVISSPKLCMITNIGIDHKEYLGDTLEQIAEEKAGIIKQGVPVAVYPSAKAAVNVIKQKAESLQNRFVTSSNERMERIPASACDNGTAVNSMRYTTANGQVYCVSLPTEAPFQLRNCALVLEGVELLKEQGVCITEQAVRDGVLQFCLPARFEILSKAPFIIADGGHNPQCIDAVVESMKSIAEEVRKNNGKIIVLTGIMRDKDYQYVYRRLSELADEYILVSADVSRALTTEELAGEVQQYGKTVYKAKTPQSGAEIALDKLSDQDCLLISGSFYIMDEIRNYINLRRCI